MVATRTRISRGARARGHRRLRTVLVALFLAAGALVCVAPALARRSGHLLSGRAMWIWELGSSSGGNLNSIIGLAHQNGLNTLIIKSSDGTSFWSTQFTPGLVSTLHAAGIRVCAWQYVYGNHPITEAYMGAQAVRDGADCLIIDAESEYAGKYIAAQSYLRRLRLLIGAQYPVALAGFPYVDYHPSFPYSVFLGPGGAQYNAPQMYWKDIGTSVDGVFAHTYEYNRIYRRPIFPLGQLYGAPPPRQVIRFRQLSRAYGASGVSWWDWQEAGTRGWTAMSRPAGDLAGYVTNRLLAPIGKGARGDLVVWAQEHLISAGNQVGVDGGFGANTQRAVMAFQTAHGLSADGIIGTETWTALLRYRTTRITWTTRHTVRRVQLTAAVTAPGRNGARIALVPRSATRRSRRNEIAGAGGAGGRPGR